MVPELVELVRPKQRAKLRGRDFSRTTYRAPATVKRLTKEYNEPPPKSLWLRWRWVALATVLLFGACVAAVSPVFAIKNVIINNAPSRESEGRLIALVQAVIGARRFGLFPQSSLVFLSTERLAGALSGEVADANVRFDRHWPNVLRITLPPNVFVATWRAGGQTFVLDKHGVLAQTLNTEDATLPLTPVNEVGEQERTLGNQVATPELATFLQGFSALWAETLPSLTLQHLEVVSADLPSLRVVTGGGWYVVVSSAGEAPAQLASLKRLLDEKIKADAAKLEYVDVRFGSKLYYKLKP